MRRYASVPEVAEYLGVSRRTVWNWVYGRKIPVLRMQGVVRIDLKQLDGQLDAATIPARF